MNKLWPDNNDTVSFGKMVEPVCRAIRSAYSIKRKPTVLKKGIEWTGLDAGPDTKVGCPSPDTCLSAENLRYDLQEQGRDPLTVIVGIAVQLGIEQGRRIHARRWQNLEEENKMLWKILKEREQQSLMVRKKHGPTS